MRFMDLGDNIEIIVYIIIMAAGLIGNAYRNYNKKKQQETQQTQQTSTNIEPSAEPEYAYEEYNYEDREASIPGTLIEEMRHQNRPRELFNTFLETTIDSSPVETNVEAELEEVVDIVADEPENIEDNNTAFLLKEEEEESSEFDLKKAVLYSEILKPKYIDTHY